jgi:hypothetical protein
MLLVVTHNIANEVTMLKHATQDIGPVCLRPLDCSGKSFLMRHACPEAQLLGRFSRIGETLARAVLVPRRCKGNRSRIVGGSVGVFGELEHARFEA